MTPRHRVVLSLQRALEKDLPSKDAESLIRMDVVRRPMNRIRSKARPTGSLRTGGPSAGTGPDH